MRTRWRSRVERAVGTAAITIVAATLLVSCATERNGGREVGGPVRWLGAEGGMSGYPPTPDWSEPWSMSFGDLPFCVDGGEKATLRGVRLDGGPEPLEVRAFVRTLSADNGPFISKLGTAPDFAEPYADSEGAGSPASYQWVEGAVVDVSCEFDEQSRADSVGVPEGTLDLAVSITAEASGFRGERLWLDYESDGDEYTVAFEWEMGLCGPGVVRPDPGSGIGYCEGYDEP